MKNLTSLVAFLFGLTVLTFIVSCDHHPKIPFPAATATKP